MPGLAAALASLEVPHAPGSGEPSGAHEVHARTSFVEALTNLFTADEGIDRGPNQTDWPLFTDPSTKKTRWKEILDFINSIFPIFPTGDASRPPPVFGAPSEAMEPMATITHQKNREAQVAAAMAEDAAAKGLVHERGIVGAVDAADQSWRGALYAMRVGSHLRNVLEDLRKVEGVEPTVKADLEKVKELHDWVEPNKPRVFSTDYERRQYESRERHFLKGWIKDREIEQLRREKKEPFEQFLEMQSKLSGLLNRPNHPPLFPPDGPGIKDGNFVVPLELPEKPVPMFIEAAAPATFS